MNTHEIDEILTADKEMRDVYIGTFSCDRLPDEKQIARPFALVANTDVHDKPGTHWVAFYCGTKEMPIEYFDSFGGEPKNPFFKQFISENDVTFSTRRVQHLLSTACGQHCIYFLKNRIKMSYTGVMKTYSYNNYMYNDRIAEIFCKDNYSFKLSKKYKHKFIEEQISRKLVKYYNECV